MMVEAGKRQENLPVWRTGLVRRAMLVIAGMGISAALNQGNKRGCYPRGIELRS